MHYKQKLSTASSGLAVLLMVILSFAFGLTGIFGSDLLASQLAILCAALLAAFITGRANGFSPLKDFGFGVAPKLKNVVSILGISVGAVLLFSPTASLVSFLLESLGVTIDMSFVDVSTPENILVTFLTVCVMPALIEEFFTRGVVMNGMLKKGVLYAVFGSAAMFALMHGNLYQLVHQFCMGCVAAYLVLVTRSLWSGVLMHFFNNAIAIVMTIASSGATETAEFSPTYLIVYAFMMAIGAFIMLPLLRSLTEREILARVEKDESKKATYTSRKKAKNLFVYRKKVLEWMNDMETTSQENTPQLNGSLKFANAVSDYALTVFAALVLVLMIVLNTVL